MVNIKMGTQLNTFFTFFCSLIVVLFTSSLNATDAKVKNDFGETLVYAYSQYDTFPPLDPDPTIFDKEHIRPTQVFTTQQVLSIDEIKPGESEFTARVLSGTYWSVDGCNQTETHRHACDNILSEGKGNHFFKADNSKEPADLLMSVRKNDVHRNIFDRMNRTQYIANVEYLETVGKYKHQFDMKYYPWEIHALEISHSSLYSTKIVDIQMLFDQNFQDAVTVPGGWKYIGSYCEISNKPFDTHELAKVSCKYYVTRFSLGWWITSFLLFASLVFASFAGSVGLISHSVAEARDDRDAARRALFVGSRMIGTYTIGLLLTYVIQVEVSPYQKPLDFWPNIPASSAVYCLGLVSMFSQSFASLVGSLFLKRPLGCDGFVGQPTLTYKIDECPKEGEHHDSMDPLVRQSNCYDEKGVPLTSPVSRIHDSTVSLALGRTPGRRRCNTKMYAVLSLEDAENINKLMKRIFIVNVVIYSLLQLVIMSILVNAYGGYNNAKKHAFREMSKHSY